MTGEMGYINNETGVDSNGDYWPIHHAIAKELNGELKPFDVYQGPYIAIGGDFVLQPNSDYRMPIQGFGIVRLWLFEHEGLPVVYREDTEQMSPFLYDDQESAVNAAKELLAN